MLLDCFDEDDEFRLTTTWFDSDDSDDSDKWWESIETSVFVLYCDGGICGNCPNEINDSDNYISWLLKIVFIFV